MRRQKFIHTLPKLSALTLAYPTDWGGVFGDGAETPRPTILEIGFGGGIFLDYLARAHPGANIIGLEISNRCLLAAESSIARNGFHNVRVVHSRAETALNHVFAPASLDAIHINFPDPWFKQGHKHRRLMQRDTLDVMVSRLKPGGILYLATDIEDYARMSARLLAQTPGLTNRLDHASVGTREAQIPGAVVTKYEARGREEGRACYYFAYARNDAPAPAIPVRKDLPMPHLVFTSPLSLDDFAARFETMRTRDEARGLFVHVSEAFRAARTHTVLFEIHVSEPTIEQHTGLSLVQHKTPEVPPYQYTLQLTSFGHPRPTEGVHLAVGALGDWLLAQHPDSHAVESRIDDEKE